MQIKTVRYVLCASTFLVAMGTAQAELSPLQKKVIADQQAMQDMTLEQRRDFRKQIFANPDKMAQRAYNQAYKAMVEANMMPKFAEAGNVTPAKSSNVARRGGIGTNITYDAGTLEMTNSGLASQSMGNKFNTGFNPNAGGAGAINPVLATGSVTAITVNMASVGGSAAFITIANGTGTGASLVTSASFPVAVGINTLTPGTPIPTAGPFLGAVWQNLGGAGTGDIVALATGTTNGQGFHAVSFNDIALTNFADVASRNAVVRVSGQLLSDQVPVELMNFSVE